MRVPASKGLFYTLASLLIILTTSWVAIQYGQGEFHLTDQGISQQTGLLAANSFPSGAEVYINDKLVTATDDTIYLEPGTYQVKITKDGFSDWQKTLTLEKGLVTQTNALLLPSAPSITPLTFTGVTNLNPSPDGSKIVYFTSSSSAQKKNGLYLLDLSNNTLSLQRGPRQVAENSSVINLETANFIWSPDSAELLIISPKKEVLIDLSKKSVLDKLPNIAKQRNKILDEWEKEMQIREEQFLARFPKEVVKIATQSAVNVYFSPDKKRLLYTSTIDQTLPDDLVPPLPAANTQPQERKLKAGGIYVYDREEDRNFRVGTASNKSKYPNKKLLTLQLNSNSFLPPASPSASLVRSLQATSSATTATVAANTAQNFNTYHSSLYADTLQWFPDSRHLLFIEGNNIKIMEYDSTNVNNLYSGPFNDKFVYPWPDGSRLLIKTSFTPQTPENLYAIELK